MQCLRKRMKFGFSTISTSIIRACRSIFFDQICLTRSVLYRSSQVQGCERRLDHGDRMLVLYIAVLWWPLTASIIWVVVGETNCIDLVQNGPHAPRRNRVRGLSNISHCIHIFLEDKSDLISQCQAIRRQCDRFRFLGGVARLACLIANGLIIRWFTKHVREGRCQKRVEIARFWSDC